MRAAGQRRDIEARLRQNPFDAADVCRLAAVRRTAERELLLAQPELLGGARLHDRQRLQRLYRRAGKNRSGHVARGKDRRAVSIDHGDRAAMPAFHQTAAQHFDENRIGHVEARNLVERV